MRLRLYLSERQANAVQFYESMALILAQAFGGKKEGNTSNPNAKVAKTKAEIMAGMQEHFGK